MNIRNGLLISAFVLVLIKASVMTMDGWLKARHVLDKSGHNGLENTIAELNRVLATKDCKVEPENEWAVLNEFRADLSRIEHMLEGKKMKFILDNGRVNVVLLGQNKNMESEIFPERCRPFILIILIYFLFLFSGLFSI